MRFEHICSGLIMQGSSRVDLRQRLRYNSLIYIKDNSFRLWFLLLIIMEFMLVLFILLLKLMIVVFHLAYLHDLLLLSYVSGETIGALFFIFLSNVGVPWLIIWSFPLLSTDLRVSPGAIMLMIRVVFRVYNYHLLVSVSRVDSWAIPCLLPCPDKLLRAGLRKTWGLGVSVIIVLA